MNDKLPPHNIDAEEAVISSLLIDGSWINSLSLQPVDFYHEVHSLIYQAMLNLKDKGISLNEITVAQELNERDKLETIGGVAYLSHLISICPTSLDCQHYANIVQRLSTYRQLIIAGGKIASLGFDAQENIDDSLAKADEMILKLKQSSRSHYIIAPSERVKLIWDRYAKLYTTEQGVALPTGLIDLDRKLGGGLFPGDLTVIGARPGVGKTSMMQCISNFIGQNNIVLFCSGEMNVASLSDRVVAGFVATSVEAIRFGGYSPEIYQDIIDKALPYIDTLKVYHVDASRNFRLTTANIYQAAYELQARHGLALIVIDYLGLLMDRYGNNQNERLGFITSNLKEMAIELDVPVLLAHQLNRALESREDKRPQLWDLRESGRIEEDADNVLFLYRENYYKPESESNITEICIAKQRQGTPGKKVNVLWDETHHTYRNLASQEELVKE